MTERRVALIQRADTYVGPALARRLAASGHDFVLHRPRDGLVEAVARLGAAVEVVREAEIPRAGAGSDATAEGMQALVRRALSRFGRLDAAALSPPSGAELGFTRGPLLQATGEQMRAMAGYLEATLHGLQAVIPAMQGRGGQILVFTSDAGARPEADWSLYGAARAGQSFLVQAAALEHAKDGICLNALGSKNAIFPGFPNCPPDAATDAQVTPGTWSAPLVAETPLGRLGTMEELAAFCSVLLDGSNRFQTAQVFHYSGGWNAL
ncbi:MAG: hypothetical protein JWQ97_1798 [Phenylobacterium sp.]|nr:hypothetical protein [Phenylobacterium sp.]